jgi:isopentenyldiphosphate isomerase
MHEGEPAPDPLEVEGWHWIGLDELRAGLRREPELYSYWLRIALENDYWFKPGAIPS